MVLRISLSPVQVVGAEHLQEKLGPGQAAIFACNHLSYMDTPVVFSKLPFQFRILARHDLFKIPFIGWYLRRVAAFYEQRRILPGRRRRRG